MGAAKSKNVANITTEAITKQTLSIVNNSTASTDQDQLISISNVDGDVIIKDNLFNQTATLNMDVLLKTLSTQKAQQDLSQKIAQSAKSLVSGINLGQYTEADNYLNAFMLASVDITTNISQTCASKIAQTQTIKVDTVKGKVTVAGNQMNQLSNLFSKCVVDNMSSQDSIQKLQNQIDQSASAESRGVSEWALVIMALIGLLVLALPVIAPVGGAMALLSKFLFPLIFFGGIALIAVYFTIKKTEMESYGFSNLLQDDKGVTRCGAKKISESTDYTTAIDACNACQDMKESTAYDWKGFNIDTQGNAVALPKPVTTFYTGAKKDGCPLITTTQDKMRIMRMPKVGISQTDPRTDKDVYGEGDVYIDPQTTEWYRLVSDEWEQHDALVKDFKGKFVFDGTNYTPPVNTTGAKGDVTVKFAGDFSPYFNVYTKSDSGWDPQETTFPGYAPDSPTGANGGSSFNSTGFKVEVQNKLFLYIGITLVFVGLLGTMVNFMKKDKQNAKNIKPASVPESPVKK